MRERGRAARVGSRVLGAAAALITALPLPASAQTPAINFGSAVELRMENTNTYDARAEENVGHSMVVLNTLLDSETPGPFVITLEQAGRVLSTGSCAARQVVYSGVEQTGQMFLRECSTEYVPAANIRTNQPVDVVVALVDDATDARTELYRGTFPVIGFYDWDGMKNGRPHHVERRALRLDSMYGVGYVRQYMNELQFSYVNTQNDASFPSDHSLRCRVGEGAWTAYDTRVSSGSIQTARNRVNDGNTVHEDGDESIVTQYIRFTTRMPIAVAGRDERPEAGSSLDGAWTCEFRTGGAGTRVVQREFRFDVRDGYIQPNPIEAQVPPGRGTVLTAIGFNPAALPMIFDPALARAAIAGRRLTGATAPIVAGMPSRAAQPRLTAVRGGRR